MIRGNPTLCGPSHLSCSDQASGDQREVRCRSSLRGGALGGTGVVSRGAPVVDDEEVGVPCPLLDRLSGCRFWLERTPGEAVGIEVPAHDGVTGRTDPIWLKGLLLGALSRSQAGWWHVNVN